MPVKETDKKSIAAIFSGQCSQTSICPIKDILAKFGDKWSMYTVLLLGQFDVMRFNQLKHEISGISQRMLAVTLRSLEEDGMVSRRVFDDQPTRVEYRLTKLGEGLLMHLLSLANWADSNFAEIMQARKTFFLRHGELEKQE